MERMLSETRQRFGHLAFRHWRFMWGLFLDVLRFSPLEMVATLSLMLFRSVTSGIGLLLIIPLLQVPGLVVSTAAVTGLTHTVIEGFHELQIPLTLLNILVGYSVVISVIAIAGFGEQIISTRLQQRYIHHLRVHLYRQLLCVRWEFFLQKTRSELLHALTAQLQSISTANYQIITMLGSAIMLVGYTGLALMLSWPMTLAAVFVGGLLTSVMLPLHRLTSRYGAISLQQNKHLTQTITEHLTALKLIKGSGIEERFVMEIQGVSEGLETRNQHITLVTSVSKLIYNMGAVIGFSVLLYLAIRVMAIPVDSLLLLLIIFSRLLPKITAIQQSYQRILHHLPAWCDFKALLQASLVNQEAFNQHHLPFTQDITLREVSYAWSSSPERAVFERISVCIKKNTTTAIVGPSGVGKTTLVDVIAGLLAPTAGTVAIDQQVLQDSNRLAWRQSVVYVTQETLLFHASMRDNLQLYSGPQPDAVLWEALKMAAAEEFVQVLPQGLDTIIGEGGIRLSAGERQRIALARALLAKPQVLVLDECTSALDRKNRMKIQQALQNLRGKMTLLIISHQPEWGGLVDQSVMVNSMSECVSIA